jgi:hypothetical protein
MGMTNGPSQSADKPASTNGWLGGIATVVVTLAFGVFKNADNLLRPVARNADAIARPAAHRADELIKPIAGHIDDAGQAIARSPEKLRPLLPLGADKSTHWADRYLMPLRPVGDAAIAVNKQRTNRNETAQQGDRSNEALDAPFAEAPQTEAALPTKLDR